uniref:Immunoglobulin domain-containing protein n=1 Tax=Oreochromis aureus TaxID=47969 RepID=A0A668TUG3_OREAU
MKSFVLITTLFGCLGWISVSGSEFQTVEVQQEVTLQCSNISAYPTQTDWFRVVNKTKPSCVSSMYGSDSEASFCHGFRNRNFNMSSNVSFVFLQIKRVDLSDAGLYFCGFYINGHTVISNASSLVPVVFATLAVFFVMAVVGLAVKINVDSVDLNSAVLRLHPQTLRSRRPAKETQVETHVVYAASA